MVLLVLTGSPGAGKTTLIRKIADKLKSSNVSVSGFYTEEIRQGGRRTGFDVVLLSGSRGPLARIRCNGEPSTGPCVGQYKVDIASFEGLALPLLQEQLVKPVRCFIIDEIGKMELFSKKFEVAVKQILLQPSTVVIATIPLPKGKPLQLVEHIRSLPTAKLFMVDINSRNSLEQVLLSQISSHVQP